MRFKSVLSALGIAVVLVIALDYASFAATGKSAILGKLNKANKVTTFQRTTNGPAVGFTTKAGQPPFTVNRPTKVTRLNSDLLDGRDSTSFATKQTTRVYEFTAGTPQTGHSFAVGAVPAGKYLATYAIWMNGANGTNPTPATGSCSLSQAGPALFDFHTTAFSSGSSVWDGSSNGPTLGLSGAGVVDTAQGNNITLSCSANKPWTTTGIILGDPITAQVTLTKIESSSSTTGSGRVGTMRKGLN